ncbi:MAG: efflux RND transporter periplasmic adaptor subunit, partial [Acidobacteriota bacterium]
MTPPEYHRNGQARGRRRTSMRSGKPWQWFAVGGALAAMASCGGGSPPPPAAAERTATVKVLHLQARQAVDMARLPADVLPNRRAVLAAEVGGAVERLTVTEGARVREGETLVSIDTRALQQALAEAEAVYRRAQADFERAEQLAERRSITRQQLIDARAAHDVALARLESARLQLSKSQVKAPWDGTVAVKRVEVGDFAVPGQPLLELVDTARLKVRAFAPAADVPYLKEGAPARVVLEGIQGEEGAD